MKTCGTQRKTTSDANAKSKLGCNKLETLKPAKSRRRASGKFSVECVEKEFSLPVQPCAAPVGLKNSIFHGTAPAICMNLSGQAPCSSAKFKLQLFPIDKTTQKLLEQDKHNPYLELTLAPKKKISSVVQHLNIKWGSSKSARGELMLFPYNAELDNLLGIERWTLKDSCTTAAQVYAAVGSPSVFRLRYGWFSNLDRTSCETSLASSCCKDKFVSEDAMAGIDKSPHPLSSEEQQMIYLNGSSTKHVEPSMLDNSVQAQENQNKPAPLSWIDCISNISFGALLSEASPSQNGNALPSQKSLNLQQIPVTCDSFDAAIASLVACQQAANQSTKELIPSLWNAEDTCHAFQFQSHTSLSQCNSALQKGTSVGSSIQRAPPDSGNVDAKHCVANEVNPQMLALYNDHNNVMRPDVSLPESSGALEPTATCSRPMSGDDSMGIASLLGSSLDAFQNFSIF